MAGFDDVSSIFSTENKNAWSSINDDDIKKANKLVGLQNSMSGAELNNAKVGLANVQTATGWANFATGIGNFVKDGLVAWGQYELSSRMMDIQEDYKDIAKNAQKDDAALKKEMVAVQERITNKSMDLQAKLARLNTNASIQIARIKKEENVAISEHKAINQLFWGRSQRHLGSPRSLIS